MGKSYKKTPVGSMTTGTGQKKFRTQENKAKRSRVNQLLHVGRYEDLPSEKEYGNEWASPRDGKRYFGYCKNDLELQDLYEKEMRK